MVVVVALVRSLSLSLSPTVMGPSGAGKTVLISALTLDALFGRATGSVTLNGVNLTNTMFKQHAYVVVQHDKLWPYLTARETLRYAGELYDIARDGLDEAVNAIIHKLGLDICADVRNSGLSGGQQKRLSLGLALLKSPTLLFLDGTSCRYSWIMDGWMDGWISVLSFTSLTLLGSLTVAVVVLFIITLPQQNPPRAWMRPRRKRLCKKLYRSLAPNT